ncbi:hypothetical protein YYG_04386 [Plasmodium vinckei petteri]|uniref:Uncharacterized protein n=1 Tax=Plasmodium vinckei petteri TaxID=138298 RepID=W7AB06_PLAVN|nr:hypothetical protein YYG_04386 [Plasmodium vinckei petteri]CAD2111883.1 conserved Plasmodium protein, unknown function [Plasmodium vinckei petteri]
MNTINNLQIIHDTSDKLKKTIEMKLHNDNYINESFRKSIGNYQVHYMPSNQQNETINYSKNSKDIGGNIIIINEKIEKFCTNTKHILTGYNNFIGIRNMEKCIEHLNNNNHIENTEKGIMNMHNINYTFSSTDNDKNSFGDCLGKMCKKQDKMNEDNNNHYDKKCNITIIDNKKDVSNVDISDNNYNEQNNKCFHKTNSSTSIVLNNDNGEDICKNVYELKNNEHDIEISSASSAKDNKIYMPEECKRNTIAINYKERLLNNEIATTKQKADKILSNEIISTNSDDNINKSIKCHEENKKKNYTKLDQCLKIKSCLDNKNLNVCGNFKIKDDGIKNIDSTTEDSTQEHDGILHTIKKNVHCCENFQMISSSNNSSLEKSSIIQTSSIDEKIVNRVKIAYKQKIKDSHDITRESYNNEHSDVYMLSTQENSDIENSISNYSYSLNKKNTHNANDGDGFEHKEIYDNKSLIEMKNTFKNSLNVPMSRLASDQIFHKNNKLPSFKNEKKLFNSGILELNHKTNSENNLLSRNMLYNHNKIFNNVFHQNKNYNVDESKYFDESKINQRDNQIKDKYFIKMSKIFSNSNDEYTKWALKDEHMEKTEKKDNKIDDGGNDKQISNLSNDLKENHNDVVKNEEIKCHVEISPDAYNNLKDEHSDNIQKISTIRNGKMNTKDVDEKDCDKSYFCCPVKEKAQIPNSTNQGLLNTIFRTFTFKKNNKFMIKSKKNSSHIREKLPNKNFHIPKKSLSLHPYYFGSKVKPSILPQKSILKNENKKDNNSIQNTKENFNKLTSLYSADINKNVIRNTQKIPQIYNKKHVNSYKYCEAVIHNNKGNLNVLNNTGEIHKTYPKCELICRIPNKQINCIHYKRFPTPKRLVTTPL